MLAIRTPKASAAAVLRLSDLTAYLNLSRSTVYQMVADCRMPAPVKLGRRASAWVKAEIDEWLMQRMLARVGLPLPKMTGG